MPDDSLDGMQDSAERAEPVAGTRSFRRNAVWTTAGNVVYAACQWGVVASLTKVGSSEMLGQFAIALAIVTPVMQLSQMQLRMVQATDATRKFQFSDYVSLRIVTTIAAVLVSIMLSIVYGGTSETTLIVFVVALGKAIDSYSDIYYGLFQQVDQMEPIAKALMFNGVVSMILLVAGIVLTGSMLVGVAGYAAGSLATQLGMVDPEGRKIARETHGRAELLTSASRERVLALARLSWPLGVVMVMVSLSGNIPRYVIEHDLGLSELGVFVAVGYLTTVGTTVVSALGQTASSRLSRDFASGRIREFRRKVLSLVLVGAGLGAVGTLLAWLVGGKLLGILYVQQYAQWGRVLVVLSFAAGIGFAASFAGYGMTAAHRFAVQLPIFAVVSCVSLVASILLVPSFGLIGAAWAVALAAGIQLLLSLAVIWGVDLSLWQLIRQRHDLEL